MLVRIIKNWDWPDLPRQTPGGSMCWDGIQFTEEPVAECDHVLILNHALEPIRVRCSPDRIWAIMQEPPTEVGYTMHRGLRCYARVFTQDAGRRGARYVHSQPALPWHVQKTYDELRSAAAPEKPRKLSWITSNLAWLPGHQRRMAFLGRLRDSVDFDLFGRGFNPIEDKWDGLAPYRYSLAVENFSGPDYWTEKIADCFLAWSMPIYFGCTNLADFFPAESYVAADIRDPDAPQQVRRVIESDLWWRRRDAIDEARRRVLERYQLFPYMAEHIRTFLAQSGSRLRPPREITIGIWPDRRERLRLALHATLRWVPPGLRMTPRKLLRRLLRR